MTTDVAVGASEHVTPDFPTPRKFTALAADAREVQKNAGAASGARTEHVERLAAQLAETCERLAALFPHDLTPWAALAIAEATSVAYSADAIADYNRRMGDFMQRRGIVQYPGLPTPIA